MAMLNHWFVSGLSYGIHVCIGRSLIVENIIRGVVAGSLGKATQKAIVVGFMFLARMRIAIKDGVLVKGSHLENLISGKTIVMFGSIVPTLATIVRVSIGVSFSDLSANCHPLDTNSQSFVMEQRTQTSSAVVTGESFNTANLNTGTERSDGNGIIKYPLTSLF